MKHTFTYIIIVCLLLSLKGRAQWELTGNNGTVPGTNFLGTTDNYELLIYTNNIQRMKVDASGTGSGSGYVTMRTTSGSQASRVHIYQGSDQNCNMQMTGNNTGNSTSDGFKIALLNPSGGPYTVELRQQENADMNFQTNATQRMTIKADGKVGIGVASPVAQLDIATSALVTSGSQIVNDQTGNTIPWSGNIYGLNISTTSGNNTNKAYGALIASTGPGQHYWCLYFGIIIVNCYYQSCYGRQISILQMHLPTTLVCKPMCMMAIPILVIQV